MKRLTIGILAHVDAGKTTLAEAMLYVSGAVRRLGRVDNRDAHLDTDARERARGITVFSKPTVFSWQELQITLLDTPGHVDFSAEMERTLQVLDYAILVVSAADGVQEHTRTLWWLLSQYQVPVFLFFNKMDQAGTDRECLLAEVKRQLNENCVDFGEAPDDRFYEAVAMCGEEALEEYLEIGTVAGKRIRELVRGRKLFPCFFGSALKLEGVEALLQGLAVYAEAVPACEVVSACREAFGARVFKIARDAQGNRLSHLKITGGQLTVKSELNGEKVNQIRVYSGEKYETVSEAEAGCVCAVTGLSKTRAGDGLGAESASGLPLLEPVFTCCVRLPEGCDAALMLPRLRLLEEEEPQLRLLWEESRKEIRVQIMGEMQTEILKSLIAERFGVEVEFGPEKVVYKETVAGCVEGVGHFEPLRHYAEVHLLLEPGEKGSGLQFASVCSEEDLAENWQRTVLSFLREKEHRGVLTGAPATDMKITLLTGRAHQKHTESGDFRQAAGRAVRQGLKQAQSVLLEPWYRFRLELPEKLLGRAMADIEKRYGRFEAPLLENGTAVLTGGAPAACLNDYRKEVTQYTGGNGRLFCSFQGYEPCHNAEEVTAEAGYDAERDPENPTGSVFCAHGAGFSVSWDRVEDYMHLEKRFQTKGSGETQEGKRERQQPESAAGREWMDAEEVETILNSTFYANSRDKTVTRGKKTPGTADTKKTYGTGTADSKRAFEAEAADPGRTSEAKGLAPKRTLTGKASANKAEEYLLVDGYNMIFAWEDLKELAEGNLDGARDRLLEFLCAYQALKGCRLTVVFDAYRLSGHETETEKYRNIQVVYTKEAETADQYIEKFAQENGRKCRVTVATSDGLEQVLVLGKGCSLLSARELREELERTKEEALNSFRETQKRDRTYLFDALKGEEAERLEDFRLGNEQE